MNASVQSFLDLTHQVRLGFGHQLHGSSLDFIMSQNVQYRHQTLFYVESRLLMHHVFLESLALIKRQ